MVGVLQERQRGSAACARIRPGLTAGASRVRASVRPAFGPEGAPAPPWSRRWPSTPALPPRRGPAWL